MKAPPKNLMIARGFLPLGGGTTKQESIMVYSFLLLLLLALVLYLKLLLPLPTYPFETIFVKELLGLVAVQVARHGEKSGRYLKEPICIRGYPYRGRLFVEMEQIEVANSMESVLFDSIVSGWSENGGEQRRKRIRELWRKICLN